MRHTMRNSVFGLITVVALNLGTLLGATVVIEEIFGLPGIGRELPSGRSATATCPSSREAVLVFGVIVVAANLGADLLYGLLDPRVRYGSAG